MSPKTNHSMDHDGLHLNETRQNKKSAQSGLNQAFRVGPRHGQRMARSIPGVPLRMPIDSRGNAGRMFQTSGGISSPDKFYTPSPFPGP